MIERRKRFSISFLTSPFCSHNPHKKFFSFVLLSLLVFFASFFSNAQDFLHDLPKIRSVNKVSGIDINSYVGFFPSRAGINSYFFYWFVENANKDSAPVIFWFSGTQGCSSMRSFLTENGPVKVTTTFGDSTTTTIEKNLYAWSTVANVVYIDQPIGTGLSPFNNDQEQLVSSSQAAAMDLVTFFKNFFKTYVPYTSSPIYFGGDSYSAKTILYLYKELKNNYDTIQINLQGFIFENPMFAPSVQLKAYSYQGFTNSILTYAAHVSLNIMYEQCLKDINAKNYESIKKISCGQIYPKLKEFSGITNDYDIRKWNTKQIDFREVKNFIATDTFYNQTLGINHDRLRSLIFNFTLCNSAVSSRFENEMFFDTPEEYLTEALNENKQVLVVSGQFDYMIPVYGVTEYLRGLNWPFREQFNIAKVKLLKSLTDDVLGQFKQVGGLTQAIIYQAGHFVSMDRPEASLTLVKSFLKNNLCNNNGHGCIPDADECPNACSGTGVCQADGSCKCNDGYEGKDCSIGKFTQSLSKPETYTSILFGREAVIYQLTVVPSTTLLNLEIAIDKLSSTGSLYVFCNVSTTETAMAPEIQKKIVRRNVEMDLHGNNVANLGYKFYNLTNFETKVYLNLQKIPVLFGLPNIISIAVLNAVDSPSKFQMRVFGVSGLEIIHTFTLMIIFILFFLIVIAFELGVIITRYRKSQARIRRRIFKYQKLFGNNDEEMIGDDDEDEDDEDDDRKNKELKESAERNKELLERKKRLLERKKGNENKGKVPEKKKEEELELLKSGPNDDDDEEMAKDKENEQTPRTFELEELSKSN